MNLDPNLAFDEIAAREMILMLVTSCQQLLIEVTSYRTAVGVLFPAAKEAFEDHARKAGEDPGIREIVAQTYDRCVATATRGLDSEAANKLFESVRTKMAIAERDVNTMVHYDQPGFSGQRTPDARGGY
jgi:hypothetical protein